MWTLLHSGIGPIQTGACLTELLPRHACSGLLSMGYCGGLDDGLQCGAAVLYSECGVLNPQTGTVTWIRATPEWVRDLEARLAREGIPSITARALTSSVIVDSPEDKLSLGTRHQAAVVDMESAALFNVAARHNLPCAALRVVLDVARQPLPDLAALQDADGQFRPGARAALLRRSPRLALQLRHAEAIAQAALTRVAGAVTWE